MESLPLPFENDEERLATAREHFAGDSFALRTCGIAIEATCPGQAVLSLPISEHLFNAKGGVQGGALFTLADLAAAVADYDPEELNTTVDATMQYLAPATGLCLYAHAHITKRGRNVSFIQVDITDDRQTQVASALFTYMHRPRTD